MLFDCQIHDGVNPSVHVRPTLAKLYSRFVVNHERTVGVFQSGVGSQDRVVRFNDRGGHLGGGVNRELELALLSVVGAQPLQQQTSETGSGTTSERVEHEESLESGTVVGETSHSVHDVVDELLSDGVVSSSVVVGGILLAVDQGLGVEERPVLSGPDLIDDVGLQVDLFCSIRSAHWPQPRVQIHPRHERKATWERACRYRSR